MSLVKHFADGESYEPLPGERLLDLQTTADVQLVVGIRKGEYMIAHPASEPQLTYVLTEEQYVRLQQQLDMQAIYQKWAKDGLLTITEVVPEPPPPAPPPDVLDNTLPPEGAARDDDRPTWR